MNNYLKDKKKNRISLDLGIRLCNTNSKCFKFQRRNICDSCCQKKVGVDLGLERWIIFD